MQTEFDVSRLNRAFYLNRRTGRWMALIGVVALSALLSFGIQKVIRQLLGGQALNVLQISVFAALVLTLGVAIAVLAWGFWTMAPGADIIRVSSEGIELRGPGSRITELQWRDKRLAFDLRDWSDQPVVASTGNTYYLAVSLGRTHALSRDAFESTLNTAQQHHVVAKVYRGSQAWYEEPPMIFRIRGVSKASRASSALVQREGSRS